jgi:hypothetical protein
MKLLFINIYNHHLTQLYNTPKIYFIEKKTIAITIRMNDKKFNDLLYFFNNQYSKHLIL